jgi:Domain of unknown function (DUF1707)
VRICDIRYAVVVAEHPDNTPKSDDSTRQLLVSHADREHALTLLQDAMAKGYVTTGEFSDRSGQALAARTRGELAEALKDLPGAEIQYTTASPAIVPASQDQVVLRGSASSLVRAGNWLVPRKLVLERQGGSVELDFSEAQIDHPVVEIELAMDRTSLEMRLPAGASASLDGVENVRASIEDHRKNAPASGSPHFVLTGYVRRGSVELRGPKRRLFE